MENVSTNTIVIMVMSGAEDGRMFEFNRTPVVIGRHPDDDVYLPYNLGVSRHHARITFEQNTYFIEDVGPKGNGSTNGTFLHGKRVTTKTSISSGDIFLLGTVWVRFKRN